MKDRKGLNQQPGPLKERQGKNKGGAFGPGGYCLCVKCGEKVPHQQGVKCTTRKCPVCGHTMVREELVEKKKEQKNG